ncbi:DUF3307 domain-containing protein [bacterium]|jgi:hypothetical protein|nr:DUF3307 domain-containing protein [Balneola sp.]MBR9918062.1 DUF3307 domain-containing protein [bacterium]
MNILALKLIIAHLIGDFTFQPDKWVKDKKQKKQKSKFLYLHLGVHALALLVLLELEWNYWFIFVTIILSHFLIDLIKLKLDGKISPRLLFVTDQLAHFSIIAALVYGYEPFQINLSILYSYESLILILSLLSLTYVSAIVMKMIMSTWEIEEDNLKNSLQSAGKYIGILERLFVFGFILLDQWQAIGLLIAAKSVFRFGDLSRAKDRKLTEYILIGTLLSFGLAITIGVAFKYFVSL